MIKRAFLEEKIEYFAALSFDSVKTVNERLLSGLDFTPSSVFVFLVPYYAGETVNISRYAASLDYHIIIKGITDRIILRLKESYPEAHFRGFGDHSPIAEERAALAAGLGVLGENGLLINEKYGSYVFIGDIITDLPPDSVGAIPPREVQRCEGCGACLAACPTGIIRGEGSDCLSAITQRKGELTAWECELMVRCNTVWGCDLCQSSCPHNESPKMTPIEVFHSDRIEELTEPLLDSLSGADFKRRAFSWRGREVLKRNLKLFRK